MTAPGKNHGRADDARAELARLLPTPAERDLPAGRHAHHREHLMRTIDNESGQAHSEGPAEAGTGARAAAPRRRSWYRRPALLAPVASVALAGALTAGLLLGGEEGGSAQQGATPKATATLGRISEAATAGDSVLRVRDDQFLYEKSRVRSGDQTSGKVVTGPLKSVESWASQRQGPIRRLGETREDGETLPINANLSDTVEGHGTPAGLVRPTYRWMSTLPTDPDELLDYLYAKTPKAGEQERDQAVFVQIGRLVGGVAPPKVAAALFQAAARIPGVAHAPQAHDAIGRKGVGIARSDTRSGERTEWIFDADTYRYLGSRSYLTRSSARGEAGTLLSSEAVLKTAVVDESGKAPKDDQVVAATPARRTGS
ncbi:CU044_5270 family protein [Streptomyces iconiensis]|uniref:CU044_5270 family protein n=1 Tax=Streptomyces iconiensis TaxID=1384038 RepID=A0ABT6ZNX1_9ACTN|nr:CU044_5270 family protein [Streptomyces iconiensis]MDJ1130746.1 CU044_5270 family protein [Streptomyces iconiensis]